MMQKLRNLIVFCWLLVLVLMLFGCKSSLRCGYKLGNVENIRFAWGEHYKSWVEMEDKEPSMESGQKIDRELIIRREIESVERDGSAIMKVTLEKVDLKIDVKKIKSEHSNSYLSTADKTESTIPDLPKLAGATYRIKIAPDTTVTQVIGLDELRKSLGIKEDDNSIAGSLLSVETIKLCHEREFMRFMPKGDPSRSKLFVVPHVMIKAQAVEKTFQKGLVQTEGNSQLALFNITGQAIHTLPQGWEPPPQPRDPYRPLIKDRSNMEEFKITGEGAFDLDHEQVARDNCKIESTLILFEDELFPEVSEAKKKKTNNIMVTQVNLYWDFKLLP